MKGMFLAATMAALLSGCVSTNLGKVRYPEAPVGFVAKDQYPVSFETAWQAIGTVLDQERIPIIQSDRTDGRLTTEYINGETKMLIGILGAAGTTTRYRYSITVSRLGKGASGIKVFATLESSEDGQGQWLNVTRKRPNEVAAIEGWLLHKIDQRLAGG